MEKEYFCAGEKVFVLRKGDLSTKEKALWQLDVSNDGWYNRKTTILFFSCPRCGKVSKDDLIAKWSFSGTVYNPHSRICRQCSSHLWLVYEGLTCVDWTAAEATK